MLLRRATPVSSCGLFLRGASTSSSLPSGSNVAGVPAPPPVPPAQHPPQVREQACPYRCSLGC
eukprot:1450230-Rhodomonas_salina.1